MLDQALAELETRQPDFYAVTYGAGGSPPAGTLELVSHLQQTLGRPAVHHYTCVGNTYLQIAAAMEAMRHAGVRNILATRGDPPRGEPDYRRRPNEPQSGCELVKFIREFRGWFCVGVAGFPEGCLPDRTLQHEIDSLLLKQAAGAEYVVTQAFFDNADYDRYRNRLWAAGVTIPVIPGILPIPEYDRWVNFCAVCGVTIPADVQKLFEPFRRDPEAMRRRAVEFGVRQCQDLLDQGAPGLHFFCLNRASPAVDIARNLRGTIQRAAA